jgi:hypothetical protein
MPKWLDDILSSRKEKKELENPASFERLIAVGTPLSSSEQSAQRQRDERAMKEQLSNFLKQQEELDDGEFTDEERDSATNAFLDEGEEKAVPDPTVKEITKQIEEFLAKLEGNQRLLPGGAEEDDALEYLLGKPTWDPSGSGSIGTGTLDLDTLSWDTGQSKWIKYASGTQNIHYWNTNRWVEIVRPEELGKVLQTNEVVGEGLTFDYLKWR